MLGWEMQLLGPGVTFHLYLQFGYSILRGGNSRVSSTGGNLVVSMGKPLLPMFLYPNQSQRSTLAPRLAILRRNLGGWTACGPGARVLP
jgi:hypothetical protein